MRPLRYSINVTLDGCCDHRVMIADEELHRHWAAELERADALLFGRVTYEMMEAAWRPECTEAQPGIFVDPLDQGRSAASMGRPPIVTRPSRHLYRCMERSSTTESSLREDLLHPGRLLPIIASRCTHKEPFRRIERAGDGLFEGEEAVLHVIERIVAPLGLRVDATSPWVERDFRMARGCRPDHLATLLPLPGPHRASSHRTGRAFAYMTEVVDNGPTSSRVPGGGPGHVSLLGSTSSRC